MVRSTTSRFISGRTAAHNPESEFTNMWETAFDVTDTTFNCNVNRTNGDASTQLSTINHFLDKIVLGQPTPDPENANITNAVSGTGALGVQVQTCVTANGRNPNFLLVDVCVIVRACQGDGSLYNVQFYEFGGGSVFEVAATANGVTYSPTTPVPTPRFTNADAASTSATSKSNGAVLRFGMGFGYFIIPAVITLGLVAGSLTVV